MNDPVNHPEQSAAAILLEAEKTISHRAKQRDSNKERSMLRCVDAFNGLTRHKLTEEQGWLFMALLKMARAQNSDVFTKDDYVDGAAYIALASEPAQYAVKETDKEENIDYNPDPAGVFSHLNKKTETTVPVKTASLGTAIYWRDGTVTYENP